MVGERHYLYLWNSSEILTHPGVEGRMTAGHRDFDDLKAHVRFLDEVEQDIRAANTKIIHERIPTLSRETIHAFAVAVGRLRARYLEAAFKLGIDEHGDPPDERQVNDLRHRREMFEEARAAFDALQHAISRGYVDVEGLHAKSPLTHSRKKT